MEQVLGSICHNLRRIGGVSESSWWIYVFPHSHREDECYKLWNSKILWFSSLLEENNLQILVFNISIILFMLPCLALPEIYKAQLSVIMCELRLRTVPKSAAEESSRNGTRVYLILFCHFMTRNQKLQCSAVLKLSG